MPKFLPVLLERAARAAAAAFLGVLIAKQAEWSAYVGASFAPIISAVLTTLSRKVGDPETGSFLK